MKISRDEVVHIALLARLGLSEEDVESFGSQLSNILENFEVLQQVNTADVPPTSHPVPLENVFREDEVLPSLPQTEVLANAPRQLEGCFQVKAVLE